MADHLVSILSVIWEECVDRELCVRIPIIGKKCIRIRACIRLIRENGTIFLEVEAFGRRWRYNLVNACHTVIEFGIGRIRVCVQAISGGVRIALQGCIGVDGVKKCWTLIAQDLRFFNLNELSPDEMSMLGYDSNELKGMGFNIDDEIGVVATPLTESEIGELLDQKESK